MCSTLAIPARPRRLVTVLVLTRKPGERVLIGDDIVITIIETRGDGVRIGFEAPRGVPIHRDEVVQAVGEANRAATQVGSDDEERLKSLLAAKKPQ